MQILILLFSLLFSTNILATQFDSNQAKMVVNQYVGMVNGTAKVTADQLKFVMSNDYLNSMGGVDHYLARLNKFKQKSSSVDKKHDIESFESVDQKLGLVKVTSQAHSILYRVILVDGKYLIDGTLEDPN
jgi:hypothetical protein